MIGIGKFHKTKRINRFFLTIMVLLFVSTALVYGASVPNKFTAGTTAKSSEVNDNFDYLAKRVWELTGNDLYYINGYIGIGTTSPDTEMEVIGTITATAFVGNGSGLTGISAGNGLDSADGSITDAVYVDNEGKVGIGTTSPNCKLDVQAYNSLPAKFIQSTDITDSESARSVLAIEAKTTGNMVDGFGPSIISYLEDNGGIFGGPSIDFIRDGADNSNAIKFRTSQADYSEERMIIKSTGNVGIGTTSPGSKLEVSGNVDADGFTINGVPIGDNY